VFRVYVVSETAQVELNEWTSESPCLAAAVGAGAQPGQTRRVTVRWRGRGGGRGAVDVSEQLPSGGDALM
jgi:hypothetical protein